MGLLGTIRWAANKEPYLFAAGVACVIGVAMPAVIPKWRRARGYETWVLDQSLENPVRRAACRCPCPVAILAIMCYVPAACTCLPACLGPVCLPPLRVSAVAVVVVWLLTACDGVCLCST